jgi:hypothetical protein
MVSIITRGCQSLWYHRPLWLGLYFLRLLLTLVFTLPVLLVISPRLEYSQFARVMLERWSLDLILELVGVEKNLLMVFVSVLLVYALLVFIIKQFLNGGIYSILLSKHPFTVRDFAAECAGQFRGHVIISLFMLIVYLLLLIAAIMIGGLIFSDLLRFRIANGKEEPFRDTLRKSADYYRTRFVQYIGLYYVYFVPFVGIWAIIEWLAVSLTSSSGSILGVLGEMILFQSCAFLRTGQSLLFTASVGREAGESLQLVTAQRVGETLGD